ncbi:MAG: hypothetical protein KAS32_07680 [Candidatus Peribacteraceae bacterium]|nr:hypothetical protein [Candidatus Peribacteraceae bacterium]
MCKALELLKEWDKYLDDYDPYAEGGLSQYGSGAIGIEAANVKERVKEIISKTEDSIKQEINGTK